MKTIAISIGDPNGIGPEIALKAANLKPLQKKCHMVLVGERDVLEFTAKKLKLRLPSLIRDCPQKQKTKIEWGKCSPRAGKASLDYVRQAAMMTINKEADAVVTCPINKEAIIKSGMKKFSGHTEYLVELCNVKDYTLSLWHGDFRVALVSTHVSLKEAIKLCKRKRIVKVGELLHRAIKSAGIRKPRIGIAGLNPHAGEAGAFGSEEFSEIIPAVKDLRRKGINAQGPIPPDVIFARLKGGMYDGVVAMYHDQGHVATKTLFFSLSKNGKSSVGGVNVTLGLPIVRTSVDHGTSFDIAGKGIADPASLVDAIELAAKLSK